MTLCGQAREDFNKYCIDRFGYCDIYDIMTVIQYEFFSQYVEVENPKLILAIGEKFNQEKLKQLNDRVLAFQKFYNENIDEINELKNDL